MVDIDVHVSSHLKEELTWAIVSVTIESGGEFLW